MTPRFRFLRALPLPLALSLGGAAAACAPHGPPPMIGGPAPGITVNGSGEVQARPDMAKVRLGVEMRSAALEEATREANAKMAAILAALRQQGIADTDLQTENYSVRFERKPPDYPEPPRPMPMPAPEKSSAPQAAPGAAPAVPAGYFVVQNVATVTVRKPEALGGVLGAALAAGANDVWGIQFDVDEPEGLQAQARAKAIADARTKAQALATQAGVTLGAPVSITELGGGGRPMPMMNMATKFAEASQVPVESGELTFSEQVQIVYAIGK